MTEKDTKKRQESQGVGFLFGNPWAVGVVVGVLYLIDYLLLDSANVGWAPAIAQWDIYLGWVSDIFNFYPNPISMGSWVIMQALEAAFFLLCATWISYIVKVRRGQVENEEAVLSNLMILSIFLGPPGFVACGYDMTGLVAEFTRYLPHELSFFPHLFMYWVLPIVITVGQELLMFSNNLLRRAFADLYGFDDLLTGDDEEEEEEEKAVVPIPVRISSIMIDPDPEVEDDELPLIEAREFSSLTELREAVNQALCKAPLGKKAVVTIEPEGGDSAVVTRKDNEGRGAFIVRALRELSRANEED